ncbi:MAG: hypothetical protein QM784_03495 [Polyangiaceae bacterium]
MFVRLGCSVAIGVVVPLSGKAIGVVVPLSGKAIGVVVPLSGKAIGVVLLGSYGLPNVPVAYRHLVRRRVSLVLYRKASARGGTSCLPARGQHPNRLALLRTRSIGPSRE